MSKTERTAKYLKRRYRQWVSAIALTKVGGLLGWRTRVSNLRKPPYRMDVRWNGSTTRSAYRYLGKLP